jgi:uncharacterized protein YkwD
LDTGTSSTHSSDGATPLTQYQRETLDLLNEARWTARYCGDAFYPSAEKLVHTSILFAAADEHAWDMATNNFVSKIGSNGSTLEARLGSTLYEFSYVGEIAYGGQLDPEDAVDAWLEVPSNCQVFMDSGFDQIGIARIEVEGKRYPAYWSVVLGQKR